MSSSEDRLFSTETFISDIMSFIQTSLQLLKETVSLSGLQSLFSLVLLAILEGHIQLLVAVSTNLKPLSNKP